MIVAAETTIPFGAVGILAIVGFVIWLLRSRSSTSSRECPYCKRRMRGDASVCPHCQRESEPWVEHDGRWWRRDEQGAWWYRRSLGDGGAQWVRFETLQTGEAITPPSQRKARLQEDVAAKQREP